MEVGFGIVDYVIFSGTLVASMLIGVYHAYVHRHGDADDYLLAGGDQSAIPVALSLTATLISAVTTLGFPAEVFLKGMTVAGYAGGSLIGVVVAALFTVPVFFPLKFTSIYSYLETRFQSPIVKKIAVFSFFVQMHFYMGVCLFGPAAALNSVTPIPSSLAILMCGVVCTAYTSIGGMRSVLWTDTFQSATMFAGLIAVLAMGGRAFDGFGNIVKANVVARRLEVPHKFWSFDPTIRHTLFSTLLGSSFIWMMSIGSSQSITQRILCLKNPRKAILTTCAAAPMYAFFMVIGMLCGLVLCISFIFCDPLKTGVLSNQNQLLPFLVAQSFGSVPGLAGLFVAAVFSSSLSTISSGINATAAVMWEDVFFHFRFCEERINPTLAMKFVSVISGAIVIGIAFVVDASGSNIFTFGVKLQSVIGGSLSAIFLAAYFVRIVTARGVVTGWAASFALSTWVVIGSVLYPARETDLLPSFVDAELCNATSGLTVTATPFSLDNFTSKFESDSRAMRIIVEALADRSSADEYEGFAIYRLSYLLVGVFSAAVFMVVAVVVSLLDGGLEVGKNIDSRFIFTFDKLILGLTGDSSSIKVALDENDFEMKKVKE